jgi:hypothetical protein
MTKGEYLKLKRSATPEEHGNGHEHRRHGRRESESKDGCQSSLYRRHPSLREPQFKRADFGSVFRRP